MSRLRVWIFVSLALVISSSDGPVFGATRPTAAQRCAAAKIAAATAPGEISANPSGIAVDGSGNVWTIDWENAAVKEFSCPCTP